MFSNESRLRLRTTSARAFTTGFTHKTKREVGTIGRPKKKYTDRYIYAPKVYAVIHNSLDVPPEIAVKLCTELGKHTITAEEIAKEMKL